MSRVVVVDDEPVVRALVAELLADAGHQVAAVASGEEALPLPADVDLLVCDLGLPGLAGEKVVEAALAERPGLAVVVMTGDAEDERATGVLAKPFSPAELLEAVAAALGGPRFRVLVAEDHPAVRASLVAYLEAQDDVVVVGEAGDGREAVALAEREAPDFVLMDIRMPGLDGIEATRAIRSRRPATRVVLLSAYEHDELIEAGLRAGAQGFLLKGASGTQLVAAVRERGGESLEAVR
ncbi:MAG TPA: response regulator [Gaiellaceae bacterium]|nr:response regulator [Gaiellaceae bacterium]